MGSVARAGIYPTAKASKFNRESLADVLPPKKLSAHIHSACLRNFSPKMLIRIAERFRMNVLELSGAARSE
jgi:hypothetical protein